MTELGGALLRNDHCVHTLVLFVASVFCEIFVAERKPRLGNCCFNTGFH